MKRALFAAAFTLMSAVTTVAVFAGPAEAHSGALTATCTTATLTATSYPAGSVLDLNVDGISAAHLVLAKPSYQDAPAVLSTTFPGTGHTVIGSITATDKAPFVQTLETAICSSASPSVTTSVSPSTSATGSSPSATSSASTSPTQSPSSCVPGSSGCVTPSPSSTPSSTVSTSVEATVITKPSGSPSASPLPAGDVLPHTGATPGIFLAGLGVLVFGCALIGLANRRRST